MSQLVGTLEVYAYADEEEVAALVYIEGVGHYYTPFTITLPIGRYTLIAEWQGQSQIKMVEIRPEETTTAKFYFQLPSPITASTIILTISVINLIITAFAVFYKKPTLFYTPPME